MKFVRWIALAVLATALNVFADGDTPIANLKLTTDANGSNLRFTNLQEVVVTTSRVNVVVFEGGTNYTLNAPIVGSLTGENTNSPLPLYAASPTSGNQVATKEYVDSIAGGTNLFAGAGTTGLITSISADTNKYLRGDGTWQTVVSSGGGTATTTYYVATTGSDTNSGLTPADAKQTIAAALLLTTNGEAISVADGTYELTNTLTVTNSVRIFGSAASNVVITLATGYTTQLVSVQADASLHSVTLRGGVADLPTFAGGGNIEMNSTGAAVYDSIIEYGKASQYGGGVLINDGGGNLYRCVIRYNEHTGSGGGGGLFSSGSGNIRNCLVYNNVAQGAGGGIFVNNAAAAANMEIRNCTVVSNRTVNGFFGFYTQAGGVALNALGSGVGGGYMQNCIVWSNAPGDMGFALTAVNAARTMWNDYGSVQAHGAVPTGPGNINTNPLFVSFANTNLALSAASPCIAAGRMFLSQYDPLYGFTNRAGARCAQGAIEFTSFPTNLYADYAVRSSTSDVAVVANFATVAGAMTNKFANYTHRMRIGFPGYRGYMGALTNYQAVLRFDESLSGFHYADFKSTALRDLAFTTSDGFRELPYEVESWGTNAYLTPGAAVVWVQVPLLTSTNDYIWAYWGSQGASNATANIGVLWSNNNAAVLHLAPRWVDGLAYVDSTTNNTWFNYYLPNGSFYTNWNGLVDGALPLNGTVGFAYNTNGSATPARYSFGDGTNDRAFSISAWVKSMGADPWQANNYVIVSKCVSAAVRGTEWALIGNTNNQLGMYLYGTNVTDTLYGYTTQTNLLRLGEWNHVVAMYNGNKLTNGFRIFINGTEAQVTGESSGTYVAMNRSPVNYVTVGNVFYSSGPTRYHNGYLDEVRIVEGLLTTNYILATYTNQLENSGFVACDPVLSYKIGDGVVAYANNAGTSVYSSAAGMADYSVRSSEATNAQYSSIANMASNVAYAGDIAFKTSNNVFAVGSTQTVDGIDVNGVVGYDTRRLTGTFLLTGGAQPNAATFTNLKMGVNDYYYGAEIQARKNIGITEENGTNFIEFVGNERVGLGTNAPQMQLHIWGTNDVAGSDDEMSNGIMLDGVPEGDKELVWADNGERQWAAYIYRNELGKYWYLYDYVADKDFIVVSRTGRIGFNKASNALEYHGLFTGTGIDDFEASGEFVLSRNVMYECVITSNAPDAFQWRRLVDLGVTYSGYSTNITMTGLAIPLEYGVAVQFTGTVNHVIGDKWNFTAFSQLPQASLDVGPQAYDEVLLTTNYNSPTVSYQDRTYNMSMVREDLLDITAFDLSTNGAIYIGRKVPFNSVYASLTLPASGMSLSCEYWNGSGWAALNATTNLYIDDTFNFTESGYITWESSTMSWATNSPDGVVDSEYNLYWMRLVSTNALTVLPIISTLTPHGSTRLGVKAAYFDSGFSWAIDANGRVIHNNTVSKVNGDIDPSQSSVLFDDFVSRIVLTTGGNSVLGWSVVAAGTGAAAASSTFGVNNVDKAIGVWSLSSGTTTNGKTSLTLAESVGMVQGGATFMFRVAPNLLAITAGATNHYGVTVGLVDNGTTAYNMATARPLNGLYFAYESWSNNNWIINSMLNGTNRQSTVTSIPVYSNQFTWLVMDIPKNVARANFYIATNGASRYAYVGSIPSNLWGNVSLMEPVMKMHKLSNTTARILYVDCFKAVFDNVGRGPTFNP